MHTTDPELGLMLLPWFHFDSIPFAHQIFAKCCNFLEIGQGFVSTFAFSNFQWPGTTPLILNIAYWYCHTNYYPFLRICRSLRPEFRLIPATKDAVTQLHFVCCIPAQFSHPFLCSVKSALFSLLSNTQRLSMSILTGLRCGGTQSTAMC